MQDLFQSMPCTEDHVQSQSKSSHVTKVSQSVSQSLYGTLCNQKNEVAYTDVSQWAEYAIRNDQAVTEGEAGNGANLYLSALLRL